MIVAQGTQHRAGEVNLPGGTRKLALLLAPKFLADEEKPS